MTRKSHVPAIRLRGVRHNNLKNFDLDLPLGRLIVISGLSGSGKSSLAFDTLYAEGQRRYIETFSPYARQFFDRMDKPQADRIDGIPPAIAIEQRNSVRSTRSTVGTMTELCDYLKLLWPHLARLHCRQCGQPVRKEPPPAVWEKVIAEWGMRNADSSSPAQAREILLTFDLALSEKLSLRESLELVSRQGYQRLLHDGQILRLDDAPAAIHQPATAITIVQDRLKLAPASRARFIEACEQAYHFGKGRLAVRRVEADPHSATGTSHFFSSGFHCAACDLDYREPVPALFSFNHPLGACPACKGFGRIISIDYDRAIPDRSKSLAGGAVKPWQTGMSAECQADLAKFCKTRKIPMNAAFSRLSAAHQRWVIEGDPGYDANDPDHSWPRAWYGVKGYFRWLESKSYKMHVRVLLSRYRAYSTCPDCQGRRLKPEALFYQLPVSDLRIPPASTPSLTLADFYALPVESALALVEQLAARRSLKPRDPLALALNEVRSRLHYLVEAGLGYLTLDRPTRTLSGGETERVNLTTCLGTRLVNTLYVLDEPSVGLHPRDTVRLVRILEQLRDTANTVVVVEHEASVIRAADRVVDLGPGQGEKGGHIVFQGPVYELLRSPDSLTGQYLSGRKRIEIPPRRPVEPARDEGRMAEARVPYTAGRPPAAVAPAPFLRVTGAACNNLKNLTVEVPLERLVALTGVSGSGKTTLVRDVLLPAIQAKLGGAARVLKPSDRLEPDENGDADESAIHNAQSAIHGWESLGQVVLVDQSPLGKTPRSNPVVYIGAFDDVRELFAQTGLAKQRGLKASAFSFNSGVGQCARCRGAGFEKIEMQFLSDVFIRCPECNGRRYRGHILEIKLTGGVMRDACSVETSDATPISNAKPRARTTQHATLPSPLAPRPSPVQWSIADILEATVDDAVDFLQAHAEAPAGRRALLRLRLLQDVGLGYLRLGQPINTLSGGESQRLKLVSHLAEAERSSAAGGGASAESATPELQPRNTRADVARWLAQRGAAGSAGAQPVEEEQGKRRKGQEKAASPFRLFPSALLLPVKETAPSPAQRRHTLFLFDEPTTGLHFDDVRVLLQAFQRLVDAGHSVLVIEHNLDVIKCADWVIDLGPEAGERGGHLVACGTPEDVAACDTSHTGRFLREVLEKRPQPGRRARAPSPLAR